MPGVASKKSLAIIGAGWAGFPVTQGVDLSLYSVTVISPVRTIQYTPLLASAACGLFDFRLAEEPIRRQKRTDVKYYKAMAESIDFDKRTISCRHAVEDLGRSRETFQVKYDRLVLAMGCDIQTFNTPGAFEHALFLRTTNDARIRELLHIRVVGGGAIGIEATAELHDLWEESMQYLYPHLQGKLQITIHDVADQVLTTFDESLSQYAMKSMMKKGVELKTSSHIEKVEADAIYTKEDGKLPYGMLLWATGNKANSLMDKLDVKTPEKGMPRILTNHQLQVLRPDGQIMEDVFAAGDAADIDGDSLPMLAEAALQKGEYLTKELNKGDSGFQTRFNYEQKANLAYLGQKDGVVGGKSEWTGAGAWLAWRSGSVAWTRSWRRKAWILYSWIWVWFNGRDIARK
ncbi:FAD/NAD(P)-binding domain-containing protein [Myriangium duriaei CBS 260.36]|uniref:FAD/NAD(P)-binding domain-containing protein n=1 Tax=Myriangium duriaei CBS 260.36 TaxID=1168546 RepID=A0A9P4IZM8_9PEZI|nr:FAD/NAD(P)-binding domain-containing protein [Myriangium duriaei CBS 260.36]